uniref:Uncharacterized protein n=1 Tax=Anguilla anguilla TaxID=7936 RepID=A0A0E9XGI0_ANGAN
MARFVKVIFIHLKKSIRIIE